MVAACVHDPEAPDNKPEVPLVSVDESSVTRVSMLVKGQFGGDMSSVTSYGVEISDELFEAGGTYQTLVPQDVTAEGFSVGVTGLKANTTYYLRSFISNGHSKMYSNTLAQKTPESSVASVSDVTVSDFYLTAVIEDDGGREITDLGFVWGTSSQRESIRRERRIPATLDKDGKTFTLPLSLLGEGTHYVLAYAEDDKSGTGFSRILCKVVINDEDEVDIEDPKFKEYLLDNHDLNVNGKISFGELTAISNIDAVTDEIASVREVAGMPLLESLNARGSEPRKGKLKSIPLGSNSNMTAVDCSNNQLTELDLSNSTGLRSLNVSGNDLPSLNCSKLMDLKYLNCLDNPNLATLYLSIAQDIEVLLVPDYTEIIYVDAPAVTGLTLERTSAAMVRGETLELLVTLQPDDAYLKSVLWTSDNPDVATVDGNGIITAISAGTATITAKAGKITATCVITVTVPVSSVTLDKTTLALTEGETYKLTATVSPEDATNQGISWRSSDSRVATVDDNGLVTAIGAGTAAVTVTTADGGLTATCEVTVARKIIHVTGVELSSTTLRIIKGNTETLTATVLPADATDKSITWASTNQGIAQVEQNGRVTGVETGSATVYVTTTDGEFVAACEVTVYVPFVDVTSITLDRTTAAMVKGETLTLTATVLPEDATVKTVTWTSDNPDVAKVDDDGNVTAVGGGSATITAKAGDLTATCTITVTVPVSSVTLDKTTLGLTEGETNNLTATVNPEDATNQGISWRSNDTRVATVDNSGLVTAIGEGTATITVTTDDGDHTATCEVTVARRIIHVTGVELSSTNLRLIKGSTETLTATVQPADATDKGVTWSSTNQNIVQVDQNGRVTGVETGTATVYVTTSDGEFVAACEVTVYVPFVDVTSITLDRTQAAMEKGETLTLTATVMPEDASVKTVTWTSENPDVAKVDDDGNVTAVGGGSAAITAKAGEFTATCTVTVTVPVSSVSLDRTSLGLTVGETDKLTATVNPGDATNQSVSWRSSNTGVAAVDNSGLVIAIGAGTATITVTTDDGGHTATCEVTVTENISHDDVLYPTARIVDFEYGSDFTGNKLQHTFTDNDALTLYPITTTVGDGVYFSVYENQGSSCVLYGNDYALKDGEQYVAYGSYMSDMVPEATEVPLYYDSQEQLSKGAWMPTDKDYLYSSRTAPYNGGCEFELQHLGALLVMDVTFKEEGICRELMLSAPEEVFTLYGTVNLLADPVAINPVETTSTTWLSLGGEDGISFEANETVRMAMMIAPVDLSGKTLNMEIYGGDNYLTGRVTGQNFQAGKAYLIKATVGPIYGWENDFNWVDIGLSVKWATNNVGTFSAEEYGDYYAWGATEPHYESLEPLTWKEGFGAGYTWTNCPYSTGGETTNAQFTKYNANDNKTTLDLTDDVAREIWGGGWRMPTAAEFEELIATRNNEANYLWEWTEMNGVAGWQIIYFGNDNSIFLPAAGTWSGTDSNNAGSQGAYWSSSLYTGDRSNARGLYFNPNGVSSYTYDRSMGLSVRPVIE